MQLYYCYPVGTGLLFPWLSKDGGGKFAITPEQSLNTLSGAWYGSWRQQKSCDSLEPC
jgi:hypothetical protein